jgi:hypothetical protein
VKLFVTKEYMMTTERRRGSLDSLIQKLRQSGEERPLVYSDTYNISFWCALARAHLEGGSSLVTRR